ncbi:MAG: DUF4157 domain-containing protein [Myxococcota bacterium]
MPFELQRKQDPRSLKLASADADKATSRDMRALAAGGFDAASQALAPVQLDGGKAGVDPALVQRAAQTGIVGAGGKLPHAQAIQASFGKHDVSGIKAQAGGAAAAACEDMGASAYASGNAVAFKGQPDVHTAAHEAAHIVQQRGGVSLPEGVGKSGDAYEKHADEVADAVVQGKSAEALLDRHGGGAGGAAVQQQAVQQHAVQMKGGLGKHLKSGANAVSNALPGGAIWDKTLTSDTTQRNDKSTKEKVRVWAMRAGSAIGQVFAPLAMAGGFFLAGAIRSYRKNKKLKKLEKAKKKNGGGVEDPRRKLADNITQLMGGDTMFKVCAEGGLGYMDVTAAILLKLGLPGGKAPSWSEEDQQKYNELEKVMVEKSSVLQRAFANYGPKVEEVDGDEIEIEENDDLGKSQTNKVKDQN